MSFNFVQACPPGDIPDELAEAAGIAVEGRAFAYAVISCMLLQMHARLF